MPGSLMCRLNSTYGWGGTPDLQPAILPGIASGAMERTRILSRETLHEGMSLSGQILA